MTKENIKTPGGKIIGVTGDMVMGVVYALQDAVWVVENTSKALFKRRRQVLHGDSPVESGRKKHWPTLS